MFRKVIWEDEKRDLEAAKKEHSQYSSFWFKVPEYGTDTHYCVPKEQYERMKIEEKILEKTTDKELIGLIEEYGDYKYQEGRIQAIEEGGID